MIFLFISKRISVSRLVFVPRTTVYDIVLSITMREKEQTRAQGGGSGGARRRVLTNRPRLPRLRLGPPFFRSPAGDPRLIPRNVFGRCLAALSLPPSRVFFPAFRCSSSPLCVSNLSAIPRIDTSDHGPRVLANSFVFLGISWIRFAEGDDNFRMTFLAFFEEDVMRFLTLA